MGREGQRQLVDLLVTGAGELATPRGTRPLGGEALGRIDVVAGGGVAVRGGRIVAVGPAGELHERFDAREELDAGGGTIVPGFVDAHTHPVFAGTRAEEFEMRTRGASYVEISRTGGGILASVRGVRESSRAELVSRLLARCDGFLALGTTTVEAKTGYGLSTADELKCLEAIEEARGATPLELVPTFLGAHEVPPEHRESPARYVDLVAGEMLPRVAESGLAEFCDVFVESHVFGLEDARRICERARELGLSLRLHVDQLTPLGGAELAAELGAASADHLEHVSDAGIEALARSGTVPVLCPLVPLVLRQEREAPARRMIDAGLPVAIATDFNPGSCYTQSMHEAIAFAALRYRMTAAECLTATTLNAACSLGRGGEIGTLEEEKRADLVVLDVPSHLHLAYDFGRPRVRAAVAAGRVVSIDPLLASRPTGD